MDETTIIILIVGVFVCLALIGGGYYYTTTLQDGDGAVMSGEKCSGMDANAIYEYDENGQCSLKECKEGFFLQNGNCIRQVDTTVASRESGELVAVDCEIKGYTKGACLGDDGMTLLGTADSCGKGTRQLFPSDILPAVNGGKCDMEAKTEECEVACPDICVATDDNYTLDGACISQGKELGDVYCGSGMQNMKLDPNTVTGFESNELRDAWIDVNWKGCAKVKSLPCEVECVQGKVRTDCPTLDSSVQKSYVVDSYNKPICFKSDYAQSVLESGGLLDRSPENILPSVTADEMWDPETGEYNPIPTGKQISYRSGGGMSFNDMVKSGCINYELEDCQAPQEPASCKVSFNTLIEECASVRCGEPLAKKVKNIVAQPAFGGGACSFDDSIREEACTGQSDKPCCDKTQRDHFDLNTPVGNWNIYGRSVAKHNPDKCSMLNNNNPVPFSRQSLYNNTEAAENFKLKNGCIPGMPLYVNFEKDANTGLFKSFGQPTLKYDDSCDNPQIYIIQTGDSGNHIWTPGGLQNSVARLGNNGSAIGFVKIPSSDDDPDTFNLFALASDKTRAGLVYFNTYHVGWPKTDGKVKLTPPLFKTVGDSVEVLTELWGNSDKIRLIKLEDYDGPTSIKLDKTVHVKECLSEYDIPAEKMNDERYVEFVTQNPCVKLYYGDKKKEYNELIQSIKTT